MTKLILLMTALILWTSTSFANLEPAGKASIPEYTQYLNEKYSPLGVSPLTDDPARSGEVYHQLNMLEQYMLGRQKLGDGSLQLLACIKCVCDGCPAKSH